MCDKEGVIEGMVAAINKLPENETKVAIIKKICQPFASKLLEIGKTDSNNDEQKKRLDYMAMEHLERLTVITKALKPVEKSRKEPHAILSVVREMWPLVEGYLIKYNVLFKVKIRKIMMSSRNFAGWSNAQ